MVYKPKLWNHVYVTIDIKWDILKKELFKMYFNIHIFLSVLNGFILFLTHAVLFNLIVVLLL